MSCKVVYFEALFNIGYQNTLNIKFRCSRTGNSAVGGMIWPKFKPSKFLWLSSLPATMKKIQSKMNSFECLQLSFHHKSMRICSLAQVQLTPQSVAGAKRQNIELIQVVLVTCDNEKDQIKNEGARVVTRFSPL